MGLAAASRVFPQVAVMGLTAVSRVFRDGDGAAAVPRVLCYLTVVGVNTGVGDRGTNPPSKSSNRSFKLQLTVQQVVHK